MCLITADTKWSQLMSKSVLVIAAVLLAGLVGAASMFMGRQPDPTIGAEVDQYFDQSAAVEERVRALEAAVAQERNARQLLEEEMQILYAQIESLGEQREEQGEQQPTDAIAMRGFSDEMRQQRDAQLSQGRSTRLVDAGFSSDRAEWILKRESELQMEAMQARFDARRSGEPADPFDPAMNPAAALRAEIGDLEYEQYLRADNRPTAVAVGTVFESSPGQAAGLQRGDNITAYGGVRVFDAADLNREIMAGQAGESVVVEITREGMPMQVVLPRGPIGVSTGRFPRRR
jgi:membrane-associated protease RseP (regulator of RpoE activity)